MKDDRYDIKKDLRFYVLSSIIWIGLAFLLADQMACISYETCGIGDFIAYLAIQISYLVPAFGISWMIIDFMNNLKNDDT